MYDEQLDFFSFRFRSVQNYRDSHLRSEATMRFWAVAVAVLNLLSVGLSVPVIDCGTLTRPIEIESREQVRVIAINPF